ncbi:MAG: molybdopterin cofactor-binding domain-containing protein, partial [Desulfobacterales bacterium]
MKKKDKISTLPSDPPPSASDISRRDFFKRMGALSGGVVVYISLGDPESWGQQQPDFNAILRIGTDGRVTCFTGKIEMGQGINTSLAQMLADELGVAFSSIDMVMGDTSLCPPDWGTFGSLTTQYFGPTLRKAAAEARTVLVEMAAETLHVSPKGLIAENGEIFDPRHPEKRVTYAQLTMGKRIERQVAEGTSITSSSRRNVSGKAMNRVDSRQKVTGEAQYTADIRLPGMLYARFLRPPVHGAKLTHVDTTGAERLEDVRVVREGDVVAVLHKTPDGAEKALGRIDAQYDTPEPTVNNKTIFDHLLDSNPPSQTVTEGGNIKKGRRLATKQFESIYYNHYVAHAPIEPHAALVHVEGEKATVWASTQAPFRAREDAAKTLGLPSQNIRVITPFVGGGFGGKTGGQQVVEAAWLAKKTGRPVQVAWDRREEFFYDTFRPAAVIKIESGLDAGNKITYWDYDNYFAGARSSETFYDIPHHRVLSRGGWRSNIKVHPFGTGAWRGPGSNTNVFAMESQIDIMAEAAGLDPLTFRLANLKNRRMSHILRAAAKQFGHSFAKAPSKRGYGIACTDYKGSYVATIAEISVDKTTGAVRVERVVCALDMGEIINPEGARLQIEGCVTMGLGYVLEEEIRFKGGKILDENFDTYSLPRFSWLPKIEPVLIDNPEMAPMGCGEAPITPMGAVIANAIYDAIGVRLFELPMTAARIRQA